MKKLSLLLFVAAGISCKKEADKKFCWKCITSVTMTPSSVGGTGSTTTTMCDKTQSDIDTYQKAATQTTTSSSGGYTVTMKSTTHCSKQ